MNTAKKQKQSVREFLATGLFKLSIVGVILLSIGYILS